MIFRADYAKDIRFDPTFRYVNDHRFIVDLAADHEFLFMPEILAKYRMHNTNISNKNPLGWAKREGSCQKILFGALQKQNVE